MFQNFLIDRKNILGCTWLLVNLVKKQGGVQQDQLTLQYRKKYMVKLVDSDVCINYANELSTKNKCRFLILNTYWSSCICIFSSLNSLKCL